MKLTQLSLALAALWLPAAGCTIGLPHGPLEPSVTADCAEYLNENWLCAAHNGPCSCAQHVPEPAPPPVVEDQPCGDGYQCPLLPGGHSAPVHIDPGPPGRFLPVPVRPVFSPQPTAYPMAPVGR